MITFQWSALQSSVSPFCPFVYLMVIVVPRRPTSPRPWRWSLQGPWSSSIRTTAAVSVKRSTITIFTGISQVLGGIEGTIMCNHLAYGRDLTLTWDCNCRLEDSRVRRLEEPNLSLPWRCSGRHAEFLLLLGSHRPWLGGTVETGDHDWMHPNSHCRPRTGVVHTFGTSLFCYQTSIPVNERIIGDNCFKLMGLLSESTYDFGFFIVKIDALRFWASCWDPYMKWKLHGSISPSWVWHFWSVPKVQLICPFIEAFGWLVVWLQMEFEDLIPVDGYGIRVKQEDIYNLPAIVDEFLKDTELVRMERSLTNGMLSQKFSVCILHGCS